MVTRYWKYAAGALLVLVLGLAAGVALWLLVTNGGARWLVGVLVRQAPGTVTVQQVEGRLWGRLRLTGIEARGPEGALSVEQLEMAWQPAALLHGKVLLTRLGAEELSISGGFESPRPEEPKPPQAWRWPELPGWLRRVRVEIRELRLSRLRWQRPAQEPLTLDRVAGRVKWTGSRLEVSRFTVLGPPGELTATLEARWRRPRVRLKVDARLEDVAGKPARLDLDVKLQPIAGQEGFSGDIRLSADSAPSGELNLSGQLQLDSREAALRDLELRQIGSSGRVSGGIHLGWAAVPLELEANLRLSHFDLARFVGQSTDLDGTLRLSGSIDDYHGRFALTNRSEDWRAVRLAGDFAGNRRQAVFSQLDAGLLKGRLQGEMTVAWQPELMVEGQLSGRNLDPSVYHADWPGNLNLEAAGRWQRPKDRPMELAVKGRLLDSRLRGHPLRGRVDGRLLGGELELAALELQGEGVSVTARGAVGRRVDFQARVKDLAVLLPGAKGALQGGGWLRWRDRQLAGAVQGRGRNLRYRDLAVKSVGFSARRLSARDPADLSLQVGEFQTAGLPPFDGRLQVSGTPESHLAGAALKLAGNAAVELDLAGGYRKERWQGTLQRLVLQDKAGPWSLARPVPVTLSARAVRFEGLVLRGAGSEELQAYADLKLKPLSGQAGAQWRDINLARANPWLAAVQLSGRAGGRAVFNLPVDGVPDLSAHIELNGRVVQERLAVDLQRVFAELTWNRSGLRGEGLVDLVEGGRVEVRCDSPEPAAPQLPPRGRWQLSWSAFDLNSLQMFLPTGMTAEGRLAGDAGGTWGPGGAFTAAGNASVAGGRLEGALAEGRIVLMLKTAEIDWDWRDRHLQGNASLELEEYGRLDSRFRLPLAARLPLAFDPQGTVGGSLTGRVRETGLVTVLFPGVLQETRGRLEIDLKAAGQWRQPVFLGRLQLAAAGAFVPSAGIELRDIAAEAELTGDRVRLTTFSLRSGPGSLNGRGEIRFDNWRVVDYRANVEGERFQLVNLPELQLQVAPRLSLQGTTRGLKVIGQVTVPEMLLRGVEQSGVVTPSEDVVIVGRELPEESKEQRFALEADVALLLGDHVLVKAKGLDARLAGQLDLKASGPDEVRASGRIAVAEGSFSAYGAKLDIERGQMLFSGPVEEPTLDILAIRTVRKVKAGVRVTGTPQAPIITLYSEPAMSDSDRLAYIVLGRPLARSSGEADLMMTAAGALLSEGESVVLQDKLKRQLGLDVLGFEAGDDQGDVATSMLTVGKYLSPNLYVGFGQSLFEETSEFRMRYTLGEHWEVESKTGTESGVDLYYKIEFR
jgi:translocation and assembly module TamB